MLLSSIITGAQKKRESNEATAVDHQACEKEGGEAQRRSGRRRRRRRRRRRSKTFCGGK
jgi:hypothetical protein